MNDARLLQQQSFSAWCSSRYWHYLGDHSTLLRNVKTTVKHPHKLSIDELAQILNDLSEAYSKRCGRTVLIVTVIDHEQNRDLISKFKSAVQETHYKPREKV